MTSDKLKTAAGIQEILLGGMSDDELSSFAGYLRRTRRRRILFSLNGRTAAPTRRETIDAVQLETLRRAEV